MKNRFMQRQEKTEVFLMPYLAELIFFSKDCLFVLWFNIPVNNYGHDETVS